MKYKIVIATLLFIGCNNPKPNEIKNNYEKLDSIIQKSQTNLTIVSGANKKSDSLVSGKVEKTVNKINHLETEVKQLKSENNELKEKLDDATDAGKPYGGLPVSGN